MLLENTLSKKIALGGILISLNIVILAMTNLIPINTMFIMGLSSLIISVIIMEFGIKSGILFYIASIILSFFVMVSKLQWILYVMTFGIYGLIKYIVEKNSSNVYLEYLIKFITVNTLMILLCIILKQFIFIPINILTISMFQVIYIIYDRAYTSFIIIYNSKIRKMINKI